MKRRNGVFIIFVILGFVICVLNTLQAGQSKEDASSLLPVFPTQEKGEIVRKAQGLRAPFIANDGQTDERVKFYAHTFGGTVFVTKEGGIVYSLPCHNNSVCILQETPCCVNLLHYTSCIVRQNCLWNYVADIGARYGNGPCGREQGRHAKSGLGGVALQEELVGGSACAVKGEEESGTKVSFFKGSDPVKWKSRIPTYDAVSLGEVYEGVEVKLRAYGNNVEKLFCVKLGASPGRIKISLRGRNPFKSTVSQESYAGKVNDAGELEVETGLGIVKFTRPVAYQEIGGKRVYVDAAYQIERCEAHGCGITRPCGSLIMGETCGKTQFAQDSQIVYSFTVAAYDKTRDLIIDPLLASTYLGGTDYENAYSVVIDKHGHVYAAGATVSSDFPTTQGAYDTSLKGNNDAFVSRFDANLSAK